MEVAKSVAEALRCDYMSVKPLLNALGTLTEHGSTKELSDDTADQLQDHMTGTRSACKWSRVSEDQSMLRHLFASRDACKV